MSCGCEKNTLQGKQYCQECMPDETSWLVPVKTIPDPFMMDRHHAYILPNNKIYVLSEDRTRAIVLGGLGGEDISRFVLDTELATKLQELRAYVDTQNNSQEYKAGLGITITPDRKIVSQVTTQDIDRVGGTALEAKEKAELALNKSGYDDTLVKQRLSALEARPDNNTVYDDSNIKQRLNALETKPDKDTTYSAGKGLVLQGNTFSTTPTEYILPLTAPIYLRDKGNGTYGYGFRGAQFLSYVKTHLSLVLGKSYESILAGGGSVTLYSNNLRISLSSSTYEYVEAENINTTSPRLIFYTFTLHVKL